MPNKLMDNGSCTFNGGKVPTELNLFDWAVEVAERGAGEILFTSMDNDGTKNGFANEALAKLSTLIFRLLLREEQEICSILLIVLKKGKPMQH
jgi:phosphoribosylformimino-5-aminoimidazole carboxamide ribonucleotide (ProFAR) isomerase